MRHCCYVESRIISSACLIWSGLLQMLIIANQHSVYILFLLPEIVDRFFRIMKKERRICINSNLLMATKIKAFTSNAKKRRIFIGRLECPRHCSVRFSPSPLSNFIVAINKYYSTGSRKCRKFDFLNKSFIIWSVRAARITRDEFVVGRVFQITAYK